MGRPSKLHQNSRGVWRFRLDGVEHCVGKSRPHAIAEYHRLMAAAGRVLDPERPSFVADGVRRWIDRNPGDDRASRLKSFAAFAGPLPLDDVARDTLTKYAKSLKRSKLANQTIIDRVGVAHRVLQWMHECGWLDVMPTKPRLPRGVCKPRDVSPDELSEMLATLPVQTGRIVRFIAYTGCRPIEARKLLWSDVDTRRKICVLGKHKTAGKTAKPRTIYLTPQAIEVLTDTPHNHSHVFTSRLGNPYGKWGLVTALRNRGITSYQLRHTFAQIASEQIPEEELAKLMGHRSPTTTRRYYEVRDKRASNAAASLTLPSPAELPEPHPQKKSSVSAAKSKKKRNPRPARTNRRVS